MVIQYYTRRGCHLCEVMLEELLPLIREKAEIELCDVDTDPEWLQKYEFRVPVIAAGEQEISSYPLDYAAVGRFLSGIDE